MRSLLLTYNIPQAKLDKLRVLCLRLGVRVRPVKPEQYGLTLSELTAQEPPEGGAAGEEPFTEEMAVMCGFSDKMVDDFLKGTRTSRIPAIPLKAVLTPTNAQWTSRELHRELSAEREAIREGRKAHTLKNT